MMSTVYDSHTSPWYTCPHSEREDMGIFSRTLPSPRGREKAPLSASLPQKRWCLLPLPNWVPHRGTPHLSPLRSGRSIPGHVCEFMATKLSTGLPGQGWGGGESRRRAASVASRKGRGRHPSSFSSVHGRPLRLGLGLQHRTAQTGGPQTALQGAQPSSESRTAPPAVPGWRQGQAEAVGTPGLSEDMGAGSSGPLLAEGTGEGVGGEAPVDSGVRACGPCQPPGARKRTSLSLSGLHFPHL